MTSTTNNGKDISDKIDERLAFALRRLIARGHDSAASYRKAAEEINDDFLQPEFERIADERDRLVETLTSVAKDLGVEIAKEGDHAIDDAHRAFVEFKLKLLGGDVGAIFREMSRGEATLERLLDGVLRGNIPKSARRKLQHQYRTVQHARDHYRSLARRMRRSHIAMSRRMSRVGSTVRQHPLATLGVLAASALVLGTVVALASHDKPRWGLDRGMLRGFEKRLRRLEKRGRRQLEDYRPRDMEKRARHGLESIGRHLRG